MSPTPTAYATDEDVALRASADFALLCPRDQKLAAGVDGAFSDGDRWSLTSASADFVAQGLAPGQVVQLLGPAPLFRPPGEALVIDAVAPRSLALRRKGQAAGVGLPPGPAGGASGVGYLVATLGPQIVRAGDELGRRLGLDARAPGLAPPDPEDRCALRDAVVLAVLHRQYFDMSRPAGEAPDTFAAKAEQVRAELDDLLARLVARRPAESAGPSAPIFTARLSR